MNVLLDDYKSIDNNGNQTGRGADVFGWDIEDRLTSATVGGNPVSYTYRGDDLRHSKTENGVTTVYTWDLAAELPVVLQEDNTSYVYGLGLISQTTGTTTSYPLADGLGSTAALTDASGAVTATYTYDVFGAVKSSTGPGSTEYRFAGQQDDPALGYQYLRARYYDPSTGRFIGKDPFPGTLQNPLTQNSYPYVVNNPTNLTDPSGLIAPLLVGALIFGAGALFGAGVSLFEQASMGGPIDGNKILISGAAGGVGTLAAVASPFFAGIGPGLDSLMTQLYENRWDFRKVDYARVGAVTATGTLVGGTFGKLGNIGNAVHKVAAECVGAVVGYLSGMGVDNAWEATEAS